MSSHSLRLPQPGRFAVARCAHHARSLGFSPSKADAIHVITDRLEDVSMLRSVG
jgi:hypothetical protein